jgi:hypothetical protein
MNESPVDQRIVDLLDDPLISLMIQADKVDRSALASMLRNLRPWRAASAGGAFRALLSQAKNLRALTAASLAPAPDLCRGCAK